MDLEGLKEVKEAMNKALEMLKKTSDGIPERIEALKDISPNDVKLLNEALERYNKAMKDIGK